MYLKVREYYANCKVTTVYTLFAFISSLFSEIGKDFRIGLYESYFLRLIFNVKMLLIAQLNYVQKEDCFRLNTPKRTENNLSKNSLVLDNRSFKVFHTRISSIKKLLAAQKFASGKVL
jgi:hypothetical protein